MRTSRLLQVIAVCGVAALFLVRVRPPERVSVPAGGIDLTESAGNQQVTITISVWGMPWEDRLFDDYYCREFERMHPEVRVKYLRMAGDLVSKYMLWHMRGDGSGADVMRQHSTSIHRLVAAGVNEPLDKYVADPESGISDMDDFAPQLRKEFTINNRLYAIPADMNQLGLIYNKDLFDAYNGRQPDKPLDYPRADWTWTDLENAASKLTVRKGAHTEIFGLDFYRGSYEFLCFYEQAGGTIWNEDKTRTLIDSPEAMDVIRFWKRMSGEMQIARPDALRDTAMGPDKFFEFGRTAMLIDGSWRVPDVMKQAPGLRFGVASLPGFRRRVTIAGSTCWALSADSKHKRIAWEFINFLSSKEASLKYWDTLWVAPPSRLSVVFDDRFKSTSGVRVDGAEVIPPLDRSEFDDKAAWLHDGFRSDPATRLPRASLAYSGLYYETLAARLQIALDRIFLPYSAYDPADEIHRCAADVNLQIEQQRKNLGSQR